MWWKLGFLTATLLFLGGCQFGQANQKTQNIKQPVHLLYWGNESSQVMETLIAQYQKDHPNIAITYKRQPVENYRAKISARLNAKKLKRAESIEAPDIVRYHASWLSELADYLAAAPAEVAKDIHDDFPAVVQETMLKGNQILGVPVSLDGLTLLVNEDLFKAKGKAVPRTWEEFGRVASELTVKNEKGALQIAGAAIGTTNNIDHWSELVGVMLLQAGVNFRVDQKTDSAAKIAQDVLNFYTGFSRGDSRVWDSNQDPSLIALANGRVVMAFAPTYRIPAILESNPHLALKAYPIPQLADKINTKEAVSFGSFWVEGVSRYTQDSTAAWDFIAWLSQPEQLYRIAYEQAKLNQFALSYPRISMLQKETDDRFLGAIVSQAPSLHTFPLVDLGDQGLNDQLINNLKVAVTGMATYGEGQTIVTKLISDFQQTLRQYGLIR